MQCFDTFRGFLHKIYAATMDGRSREGTYNFFSRRLGAANGAGHRAQGAAAPPATPLTPPMSLSNRHSVKICLWRGAPATSTPCPSAFSELSFVGFIHNLAHWSPVSTATYCARSSSQVDVICYISFVHLLQKTTWCTVFHLVSFSVLVHLTKINSIQP